MTFDRICSLTNEEEIIPESFSGNVKALLGMAMLLGIDLNYTFPKIKDMVQQKLQHTPQEQVVELEQELPQVMQSATVLNRMNKLGGMNRSNISLPKAIPVSRYQEPTAAAKPVSNSDDYLRDAYHYIKNHEGVYAEMYKDIYGHWTIGVGHLIKPHEMAKFKGKTLTDKEIEEIFQQDIKSKVALIKQHFGKVFDTYPKSLKVAILDGYFRGDLSGSPNTRKLLMQNRFPEAATAYLNNKEFIRAQKAKSGVATRMKKNAKIMHNTKI